MAFDNKRIVHLAELSVSKTDVEKLEKDELAFLATLAFAIDEISVFQKLAVQASTTKPKDNDLRILHQIQENAITRVLCSKVVEAIGLFDGFAKVLERKEESNSKEKLDEFLAELAELKADKSFLLARTIRNHSTNHYLPSVTKANIEHVSARSTFKAYLHQNQGNSFYPFGEEYVFLGRIARYYKEETEEDFTIQGIRDWMDWSLKVSSWLSATFSKYLIWLHNERYPDWLLTKKTPYLEMPLFVELGEHPLPLIFSTEAYHQKKREKDG